MDKRFWQQQTKNKNVFGDAADHMFKKKNLFLFKIVF
jgi:hypothetical protein